MSNIIYFVVPCYNEEAVLEVTAQKLMEKVESLIQRDVISPKSRITFVDDGSKDQTWPMIKELSTTHHLISGVKLSRNRGHQNALLAGLMTVKDLCDATISLDADLQDPPELIPDMISYYEAGYDDIYGRRKSRKGETWLKKTTAKLFYKLLQKSTRVDILKDTGDFRLLSRRAVEALKKYKEQRRYTKGFFALIGFKKKEFLYDRDSRVAGQSKWNYFNLFNLAIEGITSFSNFPLRLSSFLGIIVAAFGFIYIVFLVLKTLIFGEPVRGYPTLLSVIIFLGGIQLLSLGVIGEYLGRIFDEVKNRPLYFVEKYSGDEE